VSTAPAYRGRFAPSPTGPLHFGSLIAAVASFCDARAHGGAWHLRIEDVDTPRARSGASEDILATLSLYGFEWDAAVQRQSERLELYRSALDDLITRGMAYPCACTRRDLDDAPLGAGGERIYPGTCRNGVARGRQTLAWRVRVDAEPIVFRDRLQGRQEQDLAREVGDFVVKRADGLFAYQLAVVVDDAEQRITHVVRGADLLSSTARQIWLQRELRLPTPEYLHHPVAIDGRGRKLSKQTGAAPLPRNPLPALALAWRFLDQPAAPSPPASLPEFWQWACHAWNPRALPPVAMLPAPRPGDRVTV